jgi:beta-galactosidase
MAKAGAHIGGYVGFTLDISDYIKPDASNEILVRVDNAINSNIIPSQKSDFIIFGGVTRDVWLQVLPPLFVDRVHLKTPAVSSERAATEVLIQLENAWPQTQPVALEF